MRIPEDLKDSAAELSAVNRLFLEFAERNPECFDEASFTVLEEPHPWVKYPLQPWPVFVSQRQSQKLQRASRAIAEMVSDLPQRLFGHDAAQLAEHTGLDIKDASFFSGLMADPIIKPGTLARGDFVFGAGHFKCLEMNMTKPGAYGNSALADLYLEVPVLQRFLEEAGCKVSHKDNIEAFFSYLIDEALPLATNGELNFALAIDNPCPADLDEKNPMFRWLQQKAGRSEYLDRRWKEILRSRDEGLEGTAVLCYERDLIEEGERLFIGPRRIHVVADYFTKPTPRSLTIPWLAGNLRLSNGPLSKIFSDKRYLAWMSELGESDLFSAEETSIIDNHIPWTRRILPGVRTRFEGRRRLLKNILQTERHRMVLKPSVGLGGLDVLIGPKVSEQEWADGLARAFDDGTWVAQEFIDSTPLAFQYGESGWAPHDVVWGVFAFGERLGGSFLRMSPASGTGVVNALLGAREGVFFEVEGEQ